MSTEPAPAVRCTHLAGDPLAECGRTENIRQYLPGWRCPDHTPARLAGRPEAPKTGRPWWIREDGTHLPLSALPSAGGAQPKQRARRH